MFGLSGDGGVPEYCGMFGLSSDGGVPEDCGMFGLSGDGGVPLEEWLPEAPAGPPVRFISTKGTPPPPLMP